MKITLPRFLLFAFLMVAGASFCSAQEPVGMEELVIKTPGFSASKQLEAIKNQANSSNGLTFVAYYKKSDLFHFRVNRTLQPDNQLIYAIFEDVNFTIVQDQEEARKIISEITVPKTNEISTPTGNKTE